MEHNIAFQLHFMDLIREKMPLHLTLPGVLAELLNLQINSAYRRIRAEHILSARELSILAAHFHIDLEAASCMDEADTVFYRQ